jgi:DNA-binding PadR family transcriptional regulator
MEYRVLSLIQAMPEADLVSMVRHMSRRGDVHVGRVYLALERLQGRGYITVHIEPPAGRRSYRITAPGIDALTQGKEEP